MRALDDADRGTGQRQPGEGELAELLDPEEADRIGVEEIGDLDHDVAQEDAGEQVDDGEAEERGDGELGQIGKPEAKEGRGACDDLRWTCRSCCLARVLSRLR